MENEGVNIADEIMAALTECRLCAQTSDNGLFTEINVSEVTFIIPNRWGRTAEEARAISEIISNRLSNLRREGKAMVVTADLWLGRKEMMTARIRAHCGIFTRVFARECEVSRITRPEANDFLNKWHSYGTATCRHCYGLFLKRKALPKIGNNVTSTSDEIIPKGTLVAVAEFSNLWKLVRDDAEVRSYGWIRYASLPDIRINGGMGKILRKFIDDIHPDDITSYADLEWSEGDAYKKLGFREDGMRKPVLFAVDPSTMRRHPISGSRKTNAQDRRDIHQQISNDDSPETAPSTAPQDTTHKEVLYHQNFGSKIYRLTVSRN